ncbi:MAG: cysteine desulfurase [Bacteroidetes bacterium]|nr:cysteine desulfurase [Bacteroidota bacterium]
MRRVYLDHSATTPLDPAVYEVMESVFQQFFGNASSIHSFGREARLVLEESRETIAKSIGAKYDEVFFTSGGTEADNHALKGVAFEAQKRNKNHIVISAVEHHAVFETAEWLRSHGCEVDVVPVDSDARIDPQGIRKEAAAAAATMGRRRSRLLFASLSWHARVTTVVFTFRIAWRPCRSTDLPWRDPAGS